MSKYVVEPERPQKTLKRLHVAYYISKATRAQAHARARAPTHARTHMHVLAHAPARARAHTHTHTRTHNIYKTYSFPMATIFL